MNLSRYITVFEFDVLLFKIETTASLSEKNMTFFISKCLTPQENSQGNWY